MTTSYRVTSQTGTALGTVSDIAAVKALVAANPGATVKAVVTISNPCGQHAAYEADNCPVCGTSRMSF